MKPPENHIKSCQLKNWANFFPYSLYRVHWKKNEFLVHFFLLEYHALLENVDLAYFAQFSSWQLLICASCRSWHLREMHCCGPSLFWVGCNETQILGPQVVDYFRNSTITEQILKWASRQLITSISSMHHGLFVAQLISYVKLHKGDINTLNISTFKLLFILFIFPFFWGGGKAAC